MYKLSVGHAKIFCYFFASTAGFRQNSAKFSAKPAGIRWLNFRKNRPNYRQIRPIIRLLRPNFVVPNFSCSFCTSTAFRPNFSDFQQIFQNATESVGGNFSLPAEFCNTAGHRTCLSGPARARNPPFPTGAASSAREHRGGDGVLSLRCLRSSMALRRSSRSRPYSHTTRFWVMRLHASCADRR
jgi:hypothetical protein